MAKGDREFRLKAQGGTRDEKRRSAPHRRRRMSVSADTGIIGISHAYPTYPCQMA